MHGIVTETGVHISKIPPMDRRLGMDDRIDIGAMRDRHGDYRRATTSLREIAEAIVMILEERGMRTPGDGR